MENPMYKYQILDRTAEGKAKPSLIAAVYDLVRRECVSQYAHQILTMIICVSNN